METTALIGIEARVLTPFYYHGLHVDGGSATYADIITDTALLFALAAAFSPRQRVLRAKGDTAYREDLNRLPWRASLLMGEHTQALPPVRHVADVVREGGYTERFRRSTGSGNYKTTFLVHEVAAGSRYRGLLSGPDPFRLSGAPSLIVRVGVGRLGMLEIAPCKDMANVRLNTATARLFGRDAVVEDYRVLDTIRVSVPLSLEEAGRELAVWR